MSHQQEQEQMAQQRDDYGEVLREARQAMEDIRVMPRGGRQPEKWLAPETISAKGLKELKNKVLTASTVTSRRVDAALLAISLVADAVRVEQQTRYKYAYMKSLRTVLDSHEDDVLQARKDVREAKRARRETASNRPLEVELFHEDEVGELSEDEDYVDLR